MPKCYNASDPELNSTAWFVEYIGAFTPFLTLNDLNTFGPVQVLEVFVAGGWMEEDSWMDDVMDGWMGGGMVYMQMHGWCRRRWMNGCGKDGWSPKDE